MIEAGRGEKWFKDMTGDGQNQERGHPQGVNKAISDIHGSKMGANVRVERW